LIARSETVVPYPFASDVEDALIQASSAQGVGRKRKRKSDPSKNLKNLLFWAEV
jgi:hypothetical protein